MKKSIIAILLTTVFILSMIAPAFTVKATTDPSDWYMTTKGVLATDYYSLYPYETSKSLNVGFSKFGELINSETNTGLEYGGIDPFAPPGGPALTTQVPKHMWVQGWFINITYLHRTLSQGIPRNVWAMALFSDSMAYGGDWIRVDFTNDKDTTNGKLANNFKECPIDQGYLIYGTGPYGESLVNGGRKTNGTAVTDPINVLYNGPREFIAECRTTIYDHPGFKTNSTEADVGLVQIVITIVFDKVKKEVNLLKDVKSILVLKEGEELKVQFSNRGEVDLGTDSATYASYAHFYTQGIAPLDLVGNDNKAEGYPTKYNNAYEIFQTQAPQQEGQYRYFSAAGPYPQATNPTIDVAQAINDQAGYVWYAAFWPSLSDWSIDGWDNWWHSLSAYDPHYIDLRPSFGEPGVPFYIGEWDFELYYALDSEGRTQFRGVTQYGVVNQHDASDADMPPSQPYPWLPPVYGSNIIDTEVQYYLDQTFNPWDLQQAAEKYTSRYVEYWPASGAAYSTFYVTVQRWAPVVVLSDAEWNDYGVFADRLEDLTTGKMVPRSGYDITALSDGRANVTGLNIEHKYKFLYSTDADITVGGTKATTPVTLTFPYMDAGDSANFTYTGTATLPTDNLGVTHSFTFTVNMSFLLNNDSTDFSKSTSDPSLDDIKYDFRVDMEEPMTTRFYYWDNITYADAALPFSITSISREPTNLAWTITSPNHDVDVESLDIRLYLATTFVNYTAETNRMNITFAPYMGYAYTEETMGRYEWAVLGRDAATVDSVGASLVTEAFDSLKHVEIGIAGEDMFGATSDVQIPSVMAKFGSDDVVADYKDAPKTGNEVGYRAALIDDWCTYWPVTTSNMIPVGGPLANVLSYYSNDFTSAFYGIPQFSGDEYSGKITGIPCWNRAWSINYGLYNVYSSAATPRLGYAVISTYIDINGTEVFEVYGHYARDTYYACLWLHGDSSRGLTPGLLELQRMPAGVTSLILKISYLSDPKHPTYSIPELLGTISETEWTDMFVGDVGYPWVKGGIHDNA